MKKLTIGSCFSGIGGLELGLEWTGGFETKWQIENDPYATKVLEKHWPNVKRYSDIRDVSFPERVDVICGGFPCQDVSFAGKREGLQGKRSTLWGEMYRLICEVKPRWVVAENVPGLLSSDAGRFFGNILRDLAGGGYDAEWGMLSAAGVGAPHLRRRIFIVGHARLSRFGGESRWRTGKKSENGHRQMEEKFFANPRLFGQERDKKQATRTQQLGEEVADPKINTRRIRNGNYRNDEDLADSDGTGQADIQRRSTHERLGWDRAPGYSSWWDIEPNVGRVAHGIPARVDRLKCLGNAVVPQVAQKIGEMILEYEKRK